MEIVTYYAKSMKIWVAYRKDIEGNQIGDCGYGPTKEDAIRDCEDVAKERQKW